MRTDRGYRTCSAPNDRRPGDGPQTKAQRSESAKKGAATRHRNAAGDAGKDAKRAAKQAVGSGGKAAKSAGRALKAVGKAAASRAK